MNISIMYIRTVIHCITFTCTFTFTFTFTSTFTFTCSFTFTFTFALHYTTLHYIHTYNIHQYTRVAAPRHLQYLRWIVEMTSSFLAERDMLYLEICGFFLKLLCYVPWHIPMNLPCHPHSNNVLSGCFQH